MAPRIKEEWIPRGILSACECFSCEYKLTHRLRGDKVYVLCKNPCNFKPMAGEVKPAVRGIPDIEKSSGLEAQARRREHRLSGMRDYI